MDHHSSRREFLKLGALAAGATRLMNVGQVTAFHSEARRPEGHLHFAGEHTSTWFAFMNGAIESGIRAAREISNS